MSTSTNPAQEAECARSRNTAGTHSPRWAAGEPCAWCGIEAFPGAGIWLPAPPGAPSRDAELGTMQAIVDALAPLDEAAQRRVIRWALDLYHVPAEALALAVH